MRVLLTVTSLLPGYGGPAFSVTGLAAALTEIGVDVGIWAADQSATQTSLLPAGSSVRRLVGTEREALRSFGRFDVLHDNGIWLPHNHRFAKLAQSLQIPRLVSPRGMLEPWAIKHKRLKKVIAWRAYQRSDLLRAVCLHATAQAEAANLSRLFPNVPISTVANGVDIPTSFRLVNPIRLVSRRRVALFLGRLYPVKGLPMLLEAWARVRPSGWSLLISGPDEAGHRKQLEESVSALGLNENVRFGGPIAPIHKSATLFDADLFVLPSHSESFGMVVAEALAHGLPVLTTTAVPWPILDELECGWRVEPTVDGLASGLVRATRLPDDVLRTMGSRGRDMVATQLGWRNLAKRFLLTYSEAVDRLQVGASRPVKTAAAN